MNYLFLATVLSVSLGGILQVAAVGAPTCPQSENVTFYADPTDCARYYKCFRGNWTLVHCENDLLWNDVEKVCDYKENTDCVITPTPTPDPVTLDPTCPYPAGSIVYSIYPGDCRMFYECWNGVRYTMTCPDNKYWNHLKNYCDALENVNCNR
ncbi:hypothetical protein JTB14_029633 [Gonioctena quinquepunctata]|nr:hypothetical protein JTB14_029633 [Gonioctena quinquepunctata]